MWVRQSGYKPKAHHLTNILTGSIIRIEPNSSQIATEKSTHGITFRRGSETFATLFVGTYAECCDAFDKLVRYISDSAPIAFAAADDEIDTGLMD